MKRLAALLATSALASAAVRAADAAPAPAPAPAAPGYQGNPLSAMQRPEELFQYAAGLAKRGYYEDAENELHNFLDRYPDHALAPRVLYTLIDCYRKQDKRPDAYSALRQFKERWPKDERTPRLMLWQSELLIKDGKFTNAESQLRQLSLDKDEEIREAASYMRAELLQQLKRNDEAVAIYAALGASPIENAEKFPFRPYALLNLGMIHRNDRRLDEARQCFQKLFDADKAPPALREEALFRLGDVAALAGDYKKAIGEYERLLAEYQDSRFSREARKRRIQCYVNDGNCTRAVELAREWRAKQPGRQDPELAYYYGIALVGIGSYEEALKEFASVQADGQVAGPELREAASVQVLGCQMMLGRNDEVLAGAAAFAKDYPQSREISLVLGYQAQAMGAKGQWQELAQMLKKALEAGLVDDKHRYELSILLKEAHVNLKQPAEAAAVLRDLAKRPESPMPARCLVEAGMLEKQAWMADKPRQAGARERAEEDFRQVLLRFPSQPEDITQAGMALGDLYAEDGDYAKAEQAVAGLIVKDDAASRARLDFFLGWLKYRQGRYDEAGKRLRQSLEAQGEGRVAVQARYYLGACDLQQKRYDEALNIFSVLFAQPPADWPQIGGQELVHVARLFYDKNRHADCEKVCQEALKSKDAGVVYTASLQMANLYIAQNRLADAKAFLERLLKQQAETEDGGFGALHSLLGEVYMLSGDADRADLEFRKSLEAKDLDRSYAARSRWGLCELYFQEKRYDMARKLAMRATVLDDDPAYTPKAIRIAILCQIQQGDLEMAAGTWRELNQRYPLYAEKVRDDKALKPAVDFEKKLREAAKEPPKVE